MFPSVGPVLPPQSRRAALEPGPVAGGYQVYQTASNGTHTAANTLVKHVMAAGVGGEAWRLRYTNSGCGSNGDLNPANAITVKASVGASATGPWHPATKNGATSWTIEPGAYVETDPVMLHIAAGGTLYTKTYVSVSAGQVWQQQIPVGAVGVDFWASSSGGEADLTTSTAALTATTGTPYGPASVISDYAAPTTPRVVLIGDSITGAVGDNNGRGHMVRALHSVLPYQRVAVSGSRIKNLVDPSAGRRRLALMRGCNAAIVMYGINDLYAAPTSSLAQLQADHITLWGILGGMGMRVWVCTIMPRTTSTDSWATTVNQTPAGDNDTRVAFNTWVRDGAPMLNGAAAATGGSAAGTVRIGASTHPLAGYFDSADTGESARNSGVWAVNGAANYATADGAHPSPAMHQLMAAAINTAAIAAAVAGIGG